MLKLIFPLIDPPEEESVGKSFILVVLISDILYIKIQEF
jgi:hypothetical protein